MLLPITLALLAVFPGPPVLSSSDPILPEGCWPCRGANPARDGNTATPVPRGAVEQAWVHDPGGQIEGEPLVWEEKVVLAVRLNEERVALRVLDLETGEPLYKDRVLETPLPLSPSMWGNDVAVRDREDRISVLRLWPSRITTTWRWTPGGLLGPPLLVGDELYVAEREGLIRTRIGSREPEWTSPGRYRGLVSLRGDSVYALRWGRKQIAELCQLDRETGEARAWPAAPYPDAVAPVASDVVVQLLAKGAYVRSEARLWPSGLDPIYGFGTDFSKPKRREWSALGFGHAQRRALAAHKNGWLGVVTTDHGLSFSSASDVQATSAASLATLDHNPVYLEDDAIPVVAGGVCVMGPRAFDIDSGRVLWRQPWAASGRTVVGRGTLLVRRRGGALVALRERNARSVALPAVAEATFEGVVVRRGGVLEEGEIVLNATEAITGRGRKRDHWALDQVELARAEEGTVHYARNGRALVRGLECLRQEGLAAEYLELVKDARKVNDPQLLGRLVARAVERGVEEDRLISARRTLESLARRPKKIVEARRDGVIEAERRMLAASVDGLTDVLAQLPKGAPVAWRADLLRHTLALDPDHGPSLSAVRDLLPDGLAPEKGFDALDWLVFAESVSRIPLEIVTPPEERKKGEEQAGERGPRLSFAQRKLGTAMLSWRPDLVAIQSEHLLVLAPERSPGAIARCLTYGELVCEALDAIFAEGSTDRGLEDPLVIYLYESQAEYLRESPAGSEAGSGLEWTAGHYSPSQKVSRMFIPTGDEQLEGVLGTFVHELTHHWVDLLCPAWRLDELREDPGMPGYWLVEGFASMLEEFTLDVRAWEWSADNRRSLRRDMLASAPVESLIPWDALFAADYEVFGGISIEPTEVDLTSPWILGRGFALVPRVLFYAQAGATCHYLFTAEDGRYREALLSLVKAYYTGDAGGVDIEAATGFSPEELGRRVREHALSSTR